MAMMMYNPHSKRTRTSSPHGWAHLDGDILEYIFKCSLSIVDVCRSKAVCFWWNKVAESVIPSRVWSCEVPWLMFPPRGNILGRLLNVGERRFYGGGIAEIGDDAFCFGSSHGWSIYIDRNADTFLLNPFTSNQIQLPRIGSPLKIHAYFTSFSGPKDCFKKATLSSDPSKGKYLVILLWNSVYKESNLGLYKSGDVSWRAIGGKHPRYLDIMCQNKQLYAVDHNGSLKVWDLVQDCLLVKKLDVGPPTNNLFSISEDSGAVFYLVESAGKLLLTMRYVVKKSLLDKMVHFSVFELDLEQKLWREMESLGGRTLFLDANDSMSISFKQKGPQDCIYFTDKDFYFKDQKLYIGHYYGAFSLKSKNARFFVRDVVTRPLYGGKVMKQAPLWVVPPHPW